MHEETPQTVARAPEGRCPWRGEGVCLGARDTDLTHPCLMNTHAIGMLREHFRINTALDVTQRIILASSAIPILMPQEFPLPNASPILMLQEFPLISAIPILMLQTFPLNNAIPILMLQEFPLINAIPILMLQDSAKSY